MELAPDNYFPDELRMGWCDVRELRRDIAQEAQTYRIVRVLQREGLPSWEIEVEHRPTGAVFCLRWWAEWAERLRKDGGYE